MQLGMTQTQANATGWRGTDQGTQLKTGGSSGFEGLLAGYRNTSGSFSAQGAYAFLWSASESSATNGWRRNLNSGNATVNRNNNTKSNGFSVRCVKHWIKAKSHSMNGFSAYI